MQGYYAGKKKISTRTHHAVAFFSAPRIEFVFGQYPITAAALRMLVLACPQTHTGVRPRLGSN
jgi:hypothetical protein